MNERAWWAVEARQTWVVIVLAGEGIVTEAARGSVCLWQEMTPGER